MILTIGHGPCDSVKMKLTGLKHVCSRVSVPPFRKPHKGPHLMLEYWHGRLTNENLKAAWKSAEASQEKAKNRLEDVQWPCSICKKELDSTHYGVSPKADSRFLSDYWRRIMLPGEWRMCMNCKAELREFQKSATYECRACHRDLPKDQFSAERLEIWSGSRNLEQVICLQCTPLWETKWWEKKADKHQYTCSSCKKALPRSAYSADGFADQQAIVCTECNRASIVKQKNLEAKKFDCSGPCMRKQLGHAEFTSAMLLHKEVKKWLCKFCQYPLCDVCGIASDEAVPFGPNEKKEMANTKSYKRRYICEWCLYPPCGGCGLPRARSKKIQDLHFQMWFCRECYWKPTTKAEQEHPPCGDCGITKGFLSDR